MNNRWAIAAAVLLACAPAGWAQPGSSTVLRTTELRSDKLPAAPVVGSLAAGSNVRVLSLEGSWAWIETMAQDRPLRGWARANTVQSPRAENDGQRSTTGAVGVRNLPMRHNRHALIIGVSRYADASISPLPGARVDRESATQMATAMQVAPSHTRYLQDEQATGEGIRRALRELNEQVQEGDRVFIHFSGHGTRFHDPQVGGCVEALLGYDGGWPGTVTNREMAELIKPITVKTDKLFVMLDACHSGGVIDPGPLIRSRGVAIAGDEGRLRPKFTTTSQECGRPVNVKTRNLLVEAVDRGALPQDIIHLSSSRDNEISFDDENKGGLATQYMRDCMLREAKDLDGSGAISVDEIRSCAQEKINRRMEHDDRFKPHTMILSGNAAFVPAWFGNEQLQPLAEAPRPPAAAAAPAVAVAVAVAAPPPVLTAPVQPAPPPVSAPPPPLTGAQALQQMFQQRDAKRQLQVTVAADKLRIGRDNLAFSVQSDRPGYLYVAMAGSDNQSLYLLFPNDLDSDNRVERGKPLALPRSTWRVRASGPAGTNELMVMVADAPRDWAELSISKAGPFVKSLNDAAGRAALGALMTRSKAGGSDACASAAARKKNMLCSDAFGAALFNVEELP